MNDWRWIHFKAMLLQQILKIVSFNPVTVALNRETGECLFIKWWLKSDQNAGKRTGLYNHRWVNWGWTSPHYVCLAVGDCLRLVCWWAPPLTVQLLLTCLTSLFYSTAQTRVNLFEINSYGFISQSLGKARWHHEQLKVRCLLYIKRFLQSH